MMGSNSTGVDLIFALPLSELERQHASDVALKIITSAQEAVTKLPPNVRFLAIVAGVAAAAQSLHQMEQRAGPEPQAFSG